MVIKYFKLRNICVIFCLQGMQKLSIVIPVYNEKDTIEEILSAVEAVRLDSIEKEVILVDDCSTDGTRDILERYKEKYKVIFKEKNTVKKKWN